MEYFAKFMSYSTISVKALMIANVILFLAYFIFKYIKRKYIFSIFNISIFITAVALLLISMLQYNNKAWEALGSFNSVYYIDNLNKNMIINCIGFFIFIFSMALFELFYNKDAKLAIHRENLEVKHRIIVKFYIFCIILWIALVIKVWTLPVFVDRMIFDYAENNKLRPIYLACNGVIYIVCQYMFIRYMRTKQLYELLLAIAGAIVVFLVGSRSPFIDIIVNFALIFIYSNRKRFKKPNLVIISALLVTLVIGMGMLFLRSGSNAKSSFTQKMQSEIMYGNSFSDIRDGAFILYNYDIKFKGYLNGKNYLADVMSFVPSGVSEYRQKWSWGNFTAKTLVGYEDHYGLRGGPFLQAYLNFAWFGVVVVAIIAGVIYGLSETAFYRSIIKGKENFEFRFILLMLGIMFSKALFISSGFHEVYPILILSFLVLMPKKFVDFAIKLKL